MKIIARIVLSTLLVLGLAGCREAINLEDLSIGLVIGLDLDKRGKLVTYYLSPVFSENSSGNGQTVTSDKKALRLSRVEFDSKATGLTIGGKTHVILLGKRLLEHGDWYSIMDVYFRDAKNSLSARMVAVDGNVDEVMQSPRQELPPLALHLVSLIDTSKYRGETVKTNLQVFDRQMHDKGVTPYVASIGVKNGNLELLGTTLLDGNGKFITRLNSEDTMLLNLLQNEKNMQLQINASLPEKQKSDIIDNSSVSSSLVNYKNKTETGFRDGKFQFHIRLDLTLALKERLFPFDMENKQEQLEKKISEDVQKKLLRIVETCQKNKIDPIGLGHHARAFQYVHWKPVQDHWGDAFAEANVDVKVRAKIKYMGPIK